MSTQWFPATPELRASGWASLSGPLEVEKEDDDA